MTTGSGDDVDVEVLGEGRFLRLVRRQGWEHVARRGVRDIVVIVAVTPTGELLLVEQLRPAVDARVIELPAGLVGDEPEHAGEPLVAAARRELLEETGWEAKAFERLSVGPPSAGVSTEIVTLLRARELVRRGDGGGTGAENITVHPVPVAAAEAWLRQREIEGLLIDPKVYAALWFAAGSGTG